MLRTRLKDETKEWHMALEKKIMAYLTSIATEADYARILNAYLGFIQPLEKEISKYADHGLPGDLSARLRQNLLLQDIATLNNKFEYQSMGTVFIQTAGEAIGALYVLEGSTLGGKHIAAILQRKMPGTAAWQYFSGYGENNAAMWKKFTDYLDSIHDVSTQHQVVEGAKATFSAFFNWMSHSLDPIHAS